MQEEIDLGNAYAKEFAEQALMSKQLDNRDNNLEEDIGFDFSK